MKFNINLILLISIARTEFVKHYRGDVYICDNKVPETSGRNLVSCQENPTRFIFDQREDGSVIVHSPKDKGVWDVGQAGFLKIYTEHGESNQKFRFESVGGNKYQIKLLEKCLEYNSNRDQYDLNTCAMKYEQFFTIKDELPKIGEDLHKSEFTEHHINTPFDREGKVYHFTCKKDCGYHFRGHTDFKAGHHHHDDIHHEVEDN